MQSKRTSCGQRRRDIEEEDGAATWGSSYSWCSVWATDELVAQGDIIATSETVIPSSSLSHALCSISSFKQNLQRISNPIGGVEVGGRKKKKEKDAISRSKTRMAKEERE